MAKTPAQLDREIAQALESTAADYVGAAQARAMAKRGYFRDQVAHERASAPPPHAAEPIFYEIRNIGGAVLGRAATMAAAMRQADAKQAPDYALVVWKVERGVSTKVAERMRWNAAEKRRTWDPVR